MEPIDPINPIRYQAELATLVALVQSGTYEGDQVMGVLKTGDEPEIRHMLQNFGNPADPIWGKITAASPWADWQITQAVDDLNMIKPETVLPQSFAGGEAAAGRFWAW